jgi:hypothetical protein
MQSPHDYMFSQDFNPATTNVINTNYETPSSGFFPVPNAFLLLDGSNFLLLDGTDLLTLGS